MAKKTHEQFVAEVFNQVGEEYTVLSLYKGARERVIVRHNVCNEECPVTPDNFLNKRKRCGFCCGNRKNTPEQFRKQVYDLVGDEYIVLDDYINAKGPLQLLPLKLRKSNDKYKQLTYAF